MADAQPDAITLLKADHRTVEDLFAKFEAATEAEKKKRLARQICTELTVHTILEEEIFYPASKAKIEDDLVREAYVEQDGAKVLIAEIEAGSPDQEFYDAKVKVLSEQIEHHVHEEEKRSEGMFSQVPAAGLDIDGLGARMLARKKELMARFEADGLPSPERGLSPVTISRSAPLLRPPKSVRARLLPQHASLKRPDGRGKVRRAWINSGVMVDWLWSSVVEGVSMRKAACFDHCRRLTPQAAGDR